MAIAYTNALLTAYTEHCLSEQQLEIYVHGYNRNYLNMQTNIQKPGLKKLFNNKFFTYVVAGDNGQGSIVEVEIKVTGKQITYSYTNIRDRR